MSATLEMGTSSSEVKELQLKLNKVLGKKVVEPSGSFDDETMKAVGELQERLSVPTSGKYDARTAKALDEALLPRKEVKYKGTTYMLSQKQYNEVSAIFINQLKPAVRSYVRMAGEAHDHWKAHDEAQKNNVIVSWAVGKVTGAKFPSKKVITDGVDEAKEMESAVSSGDLDKVHKALENNRKIRGAFEAMDQYREELYDGSTQLVKELQQIQSNCQTTLAVCAMFLPGGFVVQVGVAAGLGSYNQLLKEIDFAGQGKSSTAGAVAGRIAVTGLVEGGLTYVLKGARGKELLGKIAKYAAPKIGSKYLAKVGSPAIEKFITKSLEGGVEKGVEDAYKLLVKACDPREKVTLDDAAKKLALSIVGGAVIKNLEDVVGDFASKNAEKYFKEAAEKFMKSGTQGKVDLKEAFKNGGSKAMEEAYGRAIDGAVADADGKPEKVKSKLEKQVLEDSALKKWFANYEKKNGKK